MELHFSEINSINNSIDNQNGSKQIHLNEPDKYWENYKQREDKKKKKVSFDDILTNMNLVVKQNGVLQYMQPLQEETSQEQYNQNSLSNLRNRETQLDPSVKNSFLYNKYFKDYKDVRNNEPEIRVPKTMEEYRQMLLEDKIKRIQQQKRISQIKSTKLLFTSDTNANINNLSIRSSVNNLNNFKNMNFY
jgi:hypothetical protein